MKSLRALIVRLRNLFRRKQQDREFAEEMASHLAMHIEDNLHSGMSQEEARRNALIKLGGSDKTYEEHRDRRAFGWIDNMQRDCRRSFRRLVKSPLSSIVIVLSLALGIGVNTAVFSMIYQIFLRPLPVEKPEELALGVNGNGSAGHYSLPFTYQGFRVMEREQQQNMAELAGFCSSSLTEIKYENNRAIGSFLGVSGGYFSLMRARPALGRPLIPADDQGAGNPVAMIGYSFWKNKLGGRTNILNQPLQINGQTLTIVGVAPKGFYNVSNGASPVAIIPLATAESIRNTLKLDFPPLSITLMARIRHGLTREQVTAYYARAYAASNDTDDNRRLKFIDGSHYRSSYVQDESKTQLYILMAATGLVLLIAMANATNLLLARTATRRRELAVCVAMGANRSKIVGQFLYEALSLAVAGSIAAIPLSYGMLRFLMLVLSQMAPEYFFGRVLLDSVSVQLEWPVMFYGLGLSLFVGLLFGLYPALEATRVAPVQVLNQESGHISEGHGTARVRKALVCVQIMLSAIFLIPTGLFLKSLLVMMNTDLGMRTEKLITFRVTPRKAGYKPEQSRAFFDRLGKELEAIPGVTGVTSAMIPLIAGFGAQTILTVEGYAGERQPRVSINEIAPGFFGQMGIPIMRGREFTEHDNLGGLKVALINEKFAKTFFAEQNPIGLKVANEDAVTIASAAGRRNGVLIPDTEIVGVVKDSHFESVKQVSGVTIFRPWRQDKDNPFIAAYGLTYYVRFTLPSAQVFTQVRKAAQVLDARVPIEDLRTMEDQVNLDLTGDRQVLRLASVLAGLATALAMMGLYGVMAYSVVRRTREIGVRMAIGAQQPAIRQMVLREMGLILAIGLGLGVPAALAIAKVVQSKLYGVSAYDPLVVAGASLALGLAAFAAAYLPAWRASRIDPLIALRCE